ncbi:hypothetical protein CAP35_13835 [Chitinophagaceae bacterium IBVUCB1]|nr:hypothetical protein CAP35_13835 [Chitinophagaceae bacterium IBVUCB1]
MKTVLYLVKTKLMKKLLLLLLLPVYSQAQMTLENTYTRSRTLQVVNLEDVGYKYISVDTANNKATLHNEDHTVWKSINLSVPSGAMYFGITCVSTKLFNADPLVEFCYSYYTTGSATTYTTILCDETGSILQTLNDTYLAGPVRFNGKWKIVTTGPNYQNRVYSVPGTYLQVKANAGQNDAELSAYPNPATDAIHLGYKLPDGIHTASMDVYSADGRRIQSYQISHQYTDILVPTGSYAPGTYFYTVQAAGMQPQTEQFIIR